MAYAVKMMTPKKYIVPTPTDFTDLITDLMQDIPGDQTTAVTLALVGDLGAGKTTFTQQLASHLGVEEPIVSPTFGIMKVYELSDHQYYDQLVHIDAYRIEDQNETGPLRLSELFTQPRTLVCVEWPERIANAMPQPVTTLTFAICEADTREVVVS